MNRAFPITLSSGTVPAFGSPVHRTPLWKSVGIVGAVHPRIGRMRAVVPHHPHPSVGHFHRAELEAETLVLVGIGDAHRLQVEVGLVQRLTVDGQSGGLPALDGLPTDGDHPLDQVVLVGRDESDERKGILHPPHRGVVGADRLVSDVPVRRPLEDDHIARLRLGEPVGQLVDHDAIADAAGAAVQRGLHRLRRDEVRPGDERQHQVVQADRDHHENDGLAQRTAPALRFVGGLGGLLVGRLGVGVERALGWGVWGVRGSGHGISVSTTVIAPAPPASHRCRPVACDLSAFP